MEEAVRESSPGGRDVLRLVADGHTNEESSEKVDLSALTVTSRPTRTARRPGTADRVTGVALGIRAEVLG